MDNKSKQFRWTVDEFKRRAVEIHGDKYDYTLIDPNDKINANTKVTIRCNACDNEFSQTVRHHIYRKQGCVDCNRYQYTYELFVKRARTVHDNKYDYSLINTEDRMRCDTKVRIKCGVCYNEFPQTVKHHIHRKQGCPKCNCSQKYTYELFLEKAIEVHGNKYDYSLINPNSEINAYAKVPIKCRTCNNEFLQVINNHINAKNGCSRCSGHEKYTYELFVKKATAVHNGKYDYSLINPDDEIGIYTKISIKCRTCCNEFLQAVNHHINDKSGCSRCSGHEKYTYELFIRKAMVIHNGKYDYSLINPDDEISAVIKVPIKCNKCSNKFLQTVDNHINGKQGCPRCKASKGEIAVENYLKLCEFDFSREYSLLLLPRKRYDFVIHDFKYIIEFDGEQHFKYNDYFFDDEEDFEERRSVDVLKTVTAIKEKYCVIRIAYTIKDIHKYLDDAINSCETLCVSDKSLYDDHIKQVLIELPNIGIFTN